MAKRKALSAKTRFDVFKRDGFACQYCGATPPNVLLHVDHIVAVAEGGTNDECNLVTACERCNLGKGARPLSEKPQSLADRAEVAAEREAQIAAYAEVITAARQRLEQHAWDVAEVMFSHRDTLPRDWLTSIKRFLDRLSLKDVFEAADIAATQCLPDPRTFRYFCAVCWGKIRADECDDDAGFGS